LIGGSFIEVYGLAGQLCFSCGIDSIGILIEEKHSSDRPHLQHCTYTRTVGPSDISRFKEVVGHKIIDESDFIRAICFIYDIVKAQYHLFSSEHLKVIFHPYHRSSIVIRRIGSGFVIACISCIATVSDFVISCSRRCDISSILVIDGDTWLSSEFHISGEACGLEVDSEVISHSWDGKVDQ
jgi:hypothetical protein